MRREIHTLIVGAFHHVHAWVNHAMNWTQSYAAAIQALSAIVIVILTWRLVRSTHRYVEATEGALELSRDQLRALRQQVNEQKRALDLAKEQYERAPLEAHRVELNEKVLEPLRRLLESSYGEPRFSAEVSPDQHYDPGAPAWKSPISAGAYLQAPDPGENADGALDIALLEDAKKNHYRDLMASWESFRISWTAHKNRRQEWIENMAGLILSESRLPPHPTGTNAPYVMHLALAMFVYERFMRRGGSQLNVRSEGHPKLSSLTGDARNYATGTNEQMNKLLDMIEILIESEGKLLPNLQDELVGLETQRQTLVREFSMAISTKTLPERCPIVGLS